MGAPCWAYPKGTITSVSWTKRRSGLWLLNSVCIPQPTSQINIADEPHRLITHQEICVHLAEVSTSENLHNGRPSTLLKSIPVGNKRCGVGRTETFPVLQYKRLASGPPSQLMHTILDTGGRNLGFRLFECSPTHKKKWVTLWPRKCQEMPRGGFSQSRGHGGL